MEEIYSETTAITSQMTMRMLSSLSEADSGRHNGLTNPEQNTLNWGNLQRKAMTNLAAEAGRMDSLMRQEAYSMINK